RGRSMSAFSAAWLDLREPVDHRSRDPALAEQLGHYLTGAGPSTVDDLGCGTGSNLRATAPLLGPEQHWTLVDQDQVLLDTAVARLSAWADRAARERRRPRPPKGNPPHQRGVSPRRSRPRARGGAGRPLSAGDRGGAVRSRLPGVHRGVRRRHRPPPIGLLYGSYVR